MARPSPKVGGRKGPAGKRKGGGKGRRRAGKGMAAAAPALESWGPPVERHAVRAEGFCDMEQLARAVRRCTACGLSDRRIRAVPGEGSGCSGIVLVGEAPGAKEDRQGRPFVGLAGKLLGKLLSERAKLSREEVFITNVVKCRPPKNRPPTGTEVEACRPYLQRQLELLGPRLVCPMGNSAVRALLDPKASITGLHGRPVESGGRRLMPLFHPAAVIYNRKLMGAMEKDFKMLGRLAREGKGGGGEEGADGCSGSGGGGEEE